MHLDIPTLAIMLTLISLVMASAVLYVAWRTPSQDGLATWGWGLVLCALACPALLLRVAGWPRLSVFSANLLTIASLALMVEALGRFQRGRGRAVPRRLVWGAVLLTEGVAVALPDQHALRVPLLTVLLGAVAAVQAWLAWSPGLTARRERGRLLLAGGSLVMVATLVVRMGMVLRADDWGTVFLVPAPILAWSYLMMVAIALLNTMGFVLMQQERAVDLQWQEATHDPLTGAANRRALNAELERSLARASRSGLPVALLMLDIDWFKKVNDTWGHQVGDGVLAGLVQRLQDRLRPYDLLARFGGEEFVVLLPDTAPDGARAVAEDMRRSVAAAPVMVGRQAVPVTLSVGVAVVQPTVVEGTAERLIRAADAALYRAKANGRNRVEVAPSEPGGEAA